MPGGPTAGDGRVGPAKAEPSGAGLAGVVGIWTFGDAGLSEPPGSTPGGIDDSGLRFNETYTPQAAAANTARKNRLFNEFMIVLLDGSCRMIRRPLELR
jgi:hypothetical protein